MTFRWKDPTGVLTLSKSRRVRRYRISLGGNSNLDAALRWCETHWEPVWVYEDGSYGCPYTAIVEGDTGDHVIVDGPWETP